MNALSVRTNSLVSSSPRESFWVGGAQFSLSPGHWASHSLPGPGPPGLVGRIKGHENRGWLSIAGAMYCGHALSLSRPHCSDPTLTPWKPVLETPPTYTMLKPNSTEANLDSGIAPQTRLRGARRECPNRQWVPSPDT